jgi:hypothetical protein
MRITEQLMDAAMTATIAFTKLYDGSAVVFSPIGEVAAIDCAKSNKRIALFTQNTPPGYFSIGVGDKANPDDVKGKHLPLSELSAEPVLQLMEAEFAK